MTLDKNSHLRDADIADLLRQARFDDVVFGALAMGDNISDFAARCFRRIFFIRYHAFALSQEAEEAIKKAADDGNLHAQFAYGRLLLLGNWEMEDIEKSVNYLGNAYDQGLSDAGAALSEALYYGDFGFIDRLKAKECLLESLEQLSDYGAFVHAKNTLFGTQDNDIDTGLVITVTTALIEKEEGEGMPSAIWKYLRGIANEADGNVEAACRDYEDAANNGILDAWACLATAKCMDPETGDFNDLDEYERMLNEGVQHHSAEALQLLYAPVVAAFDSLDEETQKSLSDEIIENLTTAFYWGSKTVPVLLGDIYYNGWCNQPEDNQQAWGWYARAALWENPEGYEKMFEMVSDGLIDMEQDACDNLAIRGARLGSEKLTIETVDAYYAGRLTDFAAEIEQYYVPLYKNEEDDEGPDDDGRFDAWS
ncbi:MAG: hypothetical protein ACI31C_05790 [Muribaculaceae bacterium]